MRHNSLNARLDALEAQASLMEESSVNAVDLSLVSDDTLEELHAISETQGGVTAEGYINIGMLSESAREDFDNAAARSGGGR